MKNKHYNFHYIIINLPRIKLFVFINDFFINNYNFNNQIKYIIVFSNEFSINKMFKLIENIIYWFLIKCKRVTRIVLIFKLYIIINNLYNI